MSRNGVMLKEKAVRIGWAPRLGIVIAMAGTLLALALATSGDPATSPPGTRLISGLGPPLAGGERSSLDAASQSMSFPILRPDVSLASDRTVEEVWVRDGEDPQVYVVYQSGIVVTARPEMEGLPTSDYAAAQLKDSVPGSLVDLAGVEAFEVPQDLEAGDLGSVRLVLRGTIVTVIGRGDFPPEELRQVALSVVTECRGLNAEGPHRGFQRFSGD